MPSYLLISSLKIICFLISSQYFICVLRLQSNFYTKSQKIMFTFSTGQVVKVKNMWNLKDLLVDIQHYAAQYIFRYQLVNDVEEQCEFGLHLSSLPRITHVWLYTYWKLLWNSNFVTCFHVCRDALQEHNISLTQVTSQ